MVDNHAGQEIVAGSIGGCTGILAGQPFDTIKARLQTQGIGGRELRYSTTFQCLFNIIKTEGIRGLYKGMSYPLMGQIFINATVFSVQGTFMRILQPEGGQSKIYKSLLSGTIAGLAQCVICSPMELIKLRMQVQGIGKEMYSPLAEKLLHKSSIVSEKYIGPWDTTKVIYRQSGIRGISKGFVVTMCREGPSFAVYFGSYDFIRQTMAGNGNSVDGLGLFHLMLAGGVAGCLTWTSTYPFDVVKSRIQLDMSNEYKGIIDCFRKSYRAEGSRVFFKGITSAWYRAFITNSVTLPTVTLILRYWKGNEE